MKPKEKKSQTKNDLREVKNELKKLKEKKKELYNEIESLQKKADEFKEKRDELNEETKEFAERAKEFKKKRDKYGIEYVVIHTSYLLNLASPKDDLWNKSKKGLIEEIRRADLLGIPEINTHIGAHTGSGLDAGLDRLVSALKEIEDSEVFRESGVKILLENTAGSGTKLGSDFSELGRVLKRLEKTERFGVCIDTCHGFAAGYDFSSADGVKRTLDEFDRDVGLDNLDLIHLNDSVGKLGSNKDRHAHIGRGEIGEEGFAAVVNNPDIKQLPYILETPKEELDGREADRVNLDKVMELRKP